MALSERRTFSRGTRASLFLQVLVGVCLAVAVAVLSIVVAERPGLRLRIDATESGRNSLDPQTVELLESLPEAVEIELFFEPQPGAMQGAIAEAQQRTDDLIRVVEGYVPHKLEVVRHDLLGAGRPDAVRRLLDLGADSSQKVVVSFGGRHTMLDLGGDLASFSSGDPRRNEAPSLADFRGEEALAEAFARLLTTGTPKLYFSFGHGEYSVDPVVGADGQRALRSVSRAVSDLRGEGFELGLWDPVRDGALPLDADVLAIVAPDTPFDATSVAHVQDFLDGGGRLLVAVGTGQLLEGDALAELLARHGINVGRGIVNAPFQGFQGTPECETLNLEPERLSSGHPITRSLRERERRLILTGARAFTPRGPAPFDGSLLDLMTSPEGAWRDLPDARAGWNNLYDPSREERGVFSLALAAEIEAPTAAEDARLVALGTPTLVGDEWYGFDRDFARNAFNWLADREVRIRVSPRDPFESRIDVARGSEYRVIGWVGLGVLPGACVLLGLLATWMRHRGS